MAKKDNKNKTDNSEKHEYDNIFKDKWTKASLEVLKEILQEDFTGLEEKPNEFSRKLRKADFVYLREKNNEKEVFHLEIQTINDSAMLARMLLYAGFLYEDYGGVPVKQAVLYLGNNKTANTAKIGYFNYEYKVIYIKDIKYTHFLKHKSRLVFAILGDFNGDSLKTVLEAIFAKAENYFKQRKDFEELVQDIEKFSILRGLQDEVRTLIPTIMPFELDYRKTPTYIEGKLKGELDVAKTMLLKGYTIVQVQDVTGLSFEQINALVDEINTKK